MSVAKVIEVISESDESWEDAAQKAVDHASVSVKNIRHVYVKDMQAMVEDNQIVKWRLNCNITFVVEHHHGNAE